MEKISDKIVMVVDSGQFVSFAQSLAPYFKKVYYYKPFQMNGYAHINDAMIGYGYDGITRVEDMWIVSDEIDLFVFTDLYHIGLQNELIKQGKLVFGAGNSEMIEIDRWKFRKMLQKLNLARAGATMIKGIDKLEAHLKTVKNKYVKISKYRKLHETFRHINYEHSKSIINDIKAQSGNLGNFVEFIVEDEIKSICEIGYDGFIIEGKYPKNAFFGLEIKDCAYIGKTISYDKLPKVVKDINEKCAPYFANYRMFYSNEIRLANKNTGYLTDPTCRLPSPCSEIYQNLIANLGEILYEGAKGNLVEPIYSDKYAGELIITSEILAQGIEQCVEIPKEIEPFVKLRYSYKLNGLYYCIPQGMPEVGAIIATGKSIEEVTDKLKEYADKIIGHDLVIKVDKLDCAEEELEKLADIDFIF
jgi:hypothetical protein